MKHIKLFESFLNEEEKYKILSSVRFRGRRTETDDFGSCADLDIARYGYILKKNGIGPGATGPRKVVKYEDIPDRDNGEKYEWYQWTSPTGDSKYGRLMVDIKNEIVRSQTMGEFYGNSTVD